MQLIDKNTIKKAIAKRPSDANKGTMGSLLCICGSYSMAGALIMAQKAALKCGIGLLKTALPKSIYSICAGCVLESVYYPLEQTCDGKISKDEIPFLLKQAQNSKAVLLGCGLSVCDDTIELVNSFVSNCTVPMVIDADALNCIAKNPNILKTANAPIIITPHPAEMARLINSTAKIVNENRVKTATEFSLKYNVVTVLKGKNTVVSSINGDAMINPTGNSGMATGGSGDVLAGMTASLLAQNNNCFDCALASVFLHGLAGDIAAEKFGKISMLPTDVIDCIHLAYKQCGF